MNDALWSYGNASVFEEMRSHCLLASTVLCSSLAGRCQTIKYLRSVTDVFQLKTADWSAVVTRRGELILLCGAEWSVVSCPGRAAHRFDLTSSKWRRVEMFLTATLRFLCRLRRVVWDRHPHCEGQIFNPECLSVFSTALGCGGVYQMHVVTLLRNRRFVSIPAPAFRVVSRDASLLINSCWDFVLASQIIKYNSTC